MSQELAENITGRLGLQGAVPGSVAGCAKPGKWKLLARNSEAVWGLCQGSGGEPYQVGLLLESLRNTCSCPSRLRPCKHVLALALLLEAGEVPSVAMDSSPNYPPKVAAFLTKQEKADAAPAAKERQILSPEERDAKLSEKLDQIAAAALDFSDWLEDIVRAGIANVPHLPMQVWETRAARLVDIQAPGLAAQLRSVPAVVRRGEGWSAELSRMLGLMRLAIWTLARQGELTASAREDLATFLGIPRRKEEVLCEPVLEDTWLVLGAAETREAQLLARRTWLLGQGSGRLAMHLEHQIIYGGGGFQVHLGEGAVQAALRYYPSCVPQRVLLGEWTALEEGALPTSYGHPRLDEAAECFAAALGENPWLGWLPVVLRRVTPVFHRNARWLRDEQGRAVPLLSEALPFWTLLGCSGGQSLDLFGLWTPQGFSPVSQLEGRSAVQLCPAAEVRML